MRTLPSESLRLLLVAFLGIGVGMTATAQLTGQTATGNKAETTQAQPPQQDRIASRFRFVPTARKANPPRPQFEQSDKGLPGAKSRIPQSDRFVIPARPSKIIQPAGFATKAPGQALPLVHQSSLVTNPALATTEPAADSGAVFLSEPINVYPRSNFFGISEDEICDEWEGFCGCGGLKTYRGHFGIQNLLGFNNCETCNAPKRRRAGFKWGATRGCDSCGIKD